MFEIDSDFTVHITRGDIGVIELTVPKNENELHVFQPGDEIRLRVYPKKNHDDVQLVKTVQVESETTVVYINLEKTDTKLGGIINKPVTYWYEVELNPAYWRSYGDCAKREGVQRVFWQLCNYYDTPSESDEYSRKFFFELRGSGNCKPTKTYKCPRERFCELFQAKNGRCAFRNTHLFLCF